MMERWFSQFQKTQIQHYTTAKRWIDWLWIQTTSSTELDKSLTTLKNSKRFSWTQERIFFEKAKSKIVLKQTFHYCKNSDMPHWNNWSEEGVHHLPVVNFQTKKKQFLLSPYQYIQPIPSTKATTTLNRYFQIPSNWSIYQKAIVAKVSQPHFWEYHPM